MTDGEASAAARAAAEGGSGDAPADAATGAAAPAGQPGAATGTYELLRRRLAAQVTELRSRASTLNAARTEHFGGSEMGVLTTERLRTEQNCMARDIVEVGGFLLFGYNVHVGMKTLAVEDVFSLHRLTRAGSEEGGGTVSFSDVAPGEEGRFLDDDRFRHDFTELFTYYKSARLLDLRADRTSMLMVFQTGDTLTDVKAFRWSITPDGTVRYVDDRGERDYTWPAAYDFTWVESTRGDHAPARPPKPPYINLRDAVFIDLLGGKLRVRLEDNTDDGQVVASETVEHPGQSLGDMAVSSAVVGSLTLLRIHPYRETTSRYYVVDPLTRTATRIDAIGRSAQQLPENHGIIFPGGYYLATGEMRLFAGLADDGPGATGGGPVDVRTLEFEHAIRSPNGEDVLYHYHGRSDGTSLILTYNLVRREVGTPVTGHGYSLFDDGTMVVFKDRGEPSRVHQMQVWTTPFVSDVHYAARPVGDGPLDAVGNAELVRGISDALAVCDLAEPDESGGAAPTETWNRLASAVRRNIDSYHWLGQAALSDLAEPLRAIREVAELIIDEYDKVLETRAATERAVTEATTEARRLMLDADRDLGDADAHISMLAALRRQAGVVAGLAERPYADTAAVEALGEDVGAAIAAVADRTVTTLAAPDALAGHLERTEALAAEAEQLDTAIQAEPVVEQIDQLTADLTELADVVTGLDMADTTVRTKILSDVAAVIAGANRARAVLRRRRDELASAESADAFAAEFALLEGALGAALDRASTPALADEQLARMLVTVENLDRSFGHVEAHAAAIDDRREEITQAFGARKQRLVDDRAARASRIQRNAGRLLDTIRSRAIELADRAEVISYFTTDPMVQRVKAAVGDLVEMGDQVGADELTGALAAARSEAERALRDATDLFADGGTTARFGQVRLSVNTEDPQLSIVVATDDEGRPELQYVVTGTDWREDVDTTAPELAEVEAAVGSEGMARLWRQRFPTEDASVARAEHLAGVLFNEAVAAGTMPALTEAVANGTVGELTAARVRERYEAGYERGVHDSDAALILTALVELAGRAGSLRFGAGGRAAALLYAAFGLDDGGRDRLAARAEALGHLEGTAPDAAAVASARRSVSAAVAAFCEAVGVALPAAQSGPYLLADLGASRGFSLTVGEAAVGLVDALLAALDDAGHRQDFTRAMEALSGVERSAAERSGAQAPTPGSELRHAAGDLAGRIDVARSWIASLPAAAGLLDAELDEAAALVVAGHHGLSPAPPLVIEAIHADVTTTVTGLVSTHPRIVDGALDVRIDELPARIAAFEVDVAPRWRALQTARRDLVARRGADLRLDDLRPDVFAGFVRNGLITDVYLPLIGANFAKQLGAVGAQRADQSGLLLLISPPGYGKTTLVEYVADRLGMLLIKISGPALGYGTTSLDPAAAPDATARAEIERLNLAFALGNNVLLYIDDIQHCSPELLQKFISLCDAQRRIDAVRAGEPTTFDLRGKRFAVVMAGNPYTEGGERFRVPDMLANRADTFNMGDVLSGHGEAFADSYIENALGTNATLKPLTTAPRGDLMHLLRAAAGGPLVADKLEGTYGATELEDIVKVLAHLREVREVLLDVNATYIQSAAQNDAYRTEPPFGLQGSYRNMAKMAARVVAAMTPDELEALVDDHYVGEAQTLTTGAEQNLLKLAELRETMTAEQEQRWASIKETFRLRNAGDEAGDRIAAQLAALGQQLSDIGERAVQAVSAGQGDPAETRRADWAIHRFADSLNRLDAAWGLADRMPGREKDVPPPPEEDLGHS